MNSDYCGSCGGKIEYLLKAPNFCPNCGVTLGAVSEGTTTVPQAHPAPMPDDDPEGTDIGYVPTVQKLQYEVEGDWSGIGRSHGTLGSMLNLNEPISTPDAPAPQLPSKAKAKKKSSSKKEP